MSADIAAVSIAKLQARVAFLERENADLCDTHEQLETATALLKRWEDLAQKRFISNQLWEDTRRFLFPSEFHDHESNG